MRYRFLFISVLLIGLSTSVHAQRPGGEFGNAQGMMPPPGMMPPMGMDPMYGGGIAQFGVEFATEVPQEEDKVVRSAADSLYSYYVENVKFGRTAKIVFSDNGADVTGLPEDVLLERDGAYLNIKTESAEPLAIELTGKTEDGALVLNVAAPLKLLFNNVTLKSQRGDAILSEGKNHVYAVLAEGSENVLSDCRNPELPPFMQGGMPPMGPPTGGEGGFPDFGEQPPFMMGDREEKPEDYHEVDGQRMKKPKKKVKLKVDGTFVCAGPLTISGNGGLKVHSNNKVGIKSKTSLMFRSGNMVHVTALAGKGVNAKNELYVHGGILNVDCSFSADKALTCGRNMYIRGGHTVVKAAGGEASEGVESKFLMQIDGGVLKVAAQDDAINSQGDMFINGGVVKAYSLTNDAIDSNCNLVINGGEIQACGTGIPEGGLDSNDEDGYRLFINGGTVIAVGGRNSTPERQSRQPSVQWRLDKVESGKTYSIGQACTYVSSRAYEMGGATIMFSSPKLKAGKSYPLCVDGVEVDKIERLSIPYSNVGRDSWRR